MSLNVMQCVCDRVNENASLINAHMYPPSCVETRPLPQISCECQDPITCSNETPLPDPSGATIKVPTYVTTGTYQCDENKARLLSVQKCITIYKLLY